MSAHLHQFSLLPRSRNTKIVATLGPASGTVEQIETLLRAGADCFRLNFSHGTHDEHRARVEAIRHVEAQYDQLAAGAAMAAGLSELTPDGEMPTGDEIAAQVEEFLNGLRDDEESKEA